MFASAVRHDPPVDHVHLADGPGVEARFREELLEQSVLADLDVARPEPQSLDESAGGDGALVLVVQHPSYGSDVAVDAWDLDEPQSVERYARLAVEAEAVPIWPV